jgi:uncharacterized protein
MSPDRVHPKRDRILALDVLRGFALLGVLTVNMIDFSSSAFMPGYVHPGWDTVNQIAEIGIYLLAVSKFYLLFSFLFGVGFAVQMQRMAASGRSFVPLYARRLIVLLLIGIVHAVLIWRGDILTLYAVAGFLLLIVRRLSARVLLITAAALMIFSFFMSVAISGTSDYSTGLHAADIYRDGSYADVVELRLSVTDEEWIFGQVPTVVAMFLLGLVVGRSGVLNNPDTYRPVLRRWRWLAGGVGLVFNGVLVIGLLIGDPWLWSVGMHIGAPVLAFFYASIILLNADRLSALAPVGQMALTNYLTHSIVATLIFYEYGLGLYDQVTPLMQLGLVAVIYGTQIVISNWWLRRFRFGPLEWVWRCLTYWQLEPLRRLPSADLTPAAGG